VSFVPFFVRRQSNFTELAIEKRGLSTTLEHLSSNLGLWQPHGDLFKGALEVKPQQAEVL
jgi:hypothetical protein